MSSHSIALSKALRHFENIKKLHKENVSNEYDRGLVNGLELAMSILTKKEPVFIEKKDKKRKKR